MSAPLYPRAVAFARAIWCATGDLDAACRAYEWTLRRSTCKASAITCWRRAVRYRAQAAELPTDLALRGAL